LNELEVCFDVFECDRELLGIEFEREDEIEEDEMLDSDGIGDFVGSHSLKVGFNEGG
jgi:hypothetical protein